MTDGELARFEEKVFPEAMTGCWLWAGASLPSGYGRFGRTRLKTQLAHRASYEHWKGPIAEGLVVDHLCRTPACVNPQHLEAVSQRENLRRAPTSLNAISAAKSECPNGHPYAGANLYLEVSKARRTTYRRCRICRAEQRARHG